MIKKRGLGAVIAVFLVTIAIFGITYGAWNAITTVFAPPATNQTQPITLTIQPSETPAQIADDLYNKGLIRNTLAFVVWARVKGLDTKLQAGTYTLKPGMTIDDIIGKLQNGQPAGKPLRVIDGYRLEQIAREANSIGLTNFNEQDFLNYVHHPETFPDVAKYPILQGKKSMEGLLYPDTYLVPVNYSAAQVIDLMLNEFTNALQANNLASLAQPHQLSEYQMIVLASIVQREASNVGQMPLIAGIYWNRVFAPTDETAGYMDADPTVEYAHDTDHPPAAQAPYWKNLNSLGTGSSVEPDSLWNTYTHKGLPPTPISSPSLAALKAAASPKQTSCYFFYNKPSDGSVVCEATFAKIQQDQQRDGLLK